MCIVVYKPAGHKLTDKTLANCFNHNPDGAGFAYTENGKVNIEKGFFTLDSFRAAYEPHETKQAVLHFRIKTHGEINVDNCHPFAVTNNLVFAHNGVLWRMPTDKEKSDTVLFNELILQNLVRVYGKRIIYDTAFRPLLNGYTSGSKLVFLDNKGKYTIINEQDGKWNASCWFSNDSWQDRVILPSYTETGGNNRRKKWQLHHGVGSHSYANHNSANSGAGSVIPFPRKEEVYDKPLKMGDYVKVASNVGGIHQGSLGKVMGVYENHEIEVYFPLLKRLQRVPLIALDFVYPAVENKEK